MILCAGETLIDMLPRGADFAPMPGGAALNAAVALARLGQDVALATGLSNDLFGQRLSALIDAEGIGRNWLQISDRPMTLAFVVLERGDARYAFYNEATAGRMIFPWPALPAPRAALFGGISLAIEPCGTVFEALFDALAAKGVPLMLDLNIRPAAVADEAAYRARLLRMAAQAQIVKASDEDLGWLGQSAEDLRAAGAALVCHTRGAEGVVAHWRGGRLACAAPRAELVDTVGAGDTFNAALLCALSEAERLSRAGLAALDEAGLAPMLAFATRAASLSVSRAGANPPRRSEL